MRLLPSIFYLNSLPARIFTLFWLSMLLLIGIIFSLPHLDSRLYVALKTQEALLYQQEVATAIRNHRLARIVSGASVLPFDKFEGPRPVLVDESKRILGAREEEVAYIQQFIYQVSDEGKPFKKNFYDIQVVGPFSVFLDFESEQAYSLYFISHVDAQKEIISLIFDYPSLLIVLILLISTPWIWWLSRSIGKPLSDLRVAANKVALGNFLVDDNLEKHGTIEVRQVGRSFNRMTTAVENLISNQQNLLSSISHELRTPLTRLQLTSALLRRRMGETAETLRIDKEIAQLDSMINDLLLLSRQQLNSHIERDIFPIDELWLDVINDAGFEAEQRNLIFSVKQQISNPQYYSINGNQGLLISAVENIVRNALKYTHSRIELTLSLKEKRELHITIDDDGAGIPPTEYENIFKPFYRVDEARTRTTGGTGLGLAIVASVVNEHQGRVYACKSPLGGLRVSIELPLWKLT